MPIPFPTEASPAREWLEQALTSDPQRLDLAALAIAALEYPSLDRNGLLARLDALASRVRALAPGDAPLDQARALRRVLADEEGFEGDLDQYQSPENSFLNRVLERKRGLPIALSVLYLEVARRAGLPFYGVAFPAHFLIGCGAGADRVMMDPFHQGRLLSESACVALLREVAPHLTYSASLLDPAPVATIAFRMLSNLKREYLERGDGPRALGVIDLMLVLSPDHPSELRARAAILSALGAYRAALADVERCLALAPKGADHDALTLTARALRQRVEYLN